MAKKHIYPGFSYVFLTLTALLLLGCAVTEPSRFYILQPLSGVDKTAEVADATEGLTIGIGPIKLPEYLNRPQIVTRAGENELRLAEFHRWAEPLRDNISIVLRENLRTLLSSSGISIVSWKGSPHMDYRLKVDFIRFDSTSSGEASLVARWSIWKRKQKTAYIIKTSTQDVSADAPGYDARVSALNQTLAELSREIAETLKGLRK